MPVVIDGDSGAVLPFPLFLVPLDIMRSLIDRASRVGTEKMEEKVAETHSHAVIAGMSAEVGARCRQAM